ncbi:MAG: hypothetical protein A2Y33_13675 [Spirochaetes bacterium GWF1_51_8]|nr:MAG: hypothetical protein A2Y33_13675 [Spirochaetes bacterium GWF1_51_8]
MKHIAVFVVFTLLLISCAQGSKPGIDTLIADSEKNIALMMDEYVKNVDAAFPDAALAEYDRIERAINSILFDMEMNRLIPELEKTQVKQKLMDSGKRIEGMAANKGIDLKPFNIKLVYEHLEWLSVE